MASAMSIEKYLRDLASGRPVPGGGSAAALCGAIAIALLSMVAVYTRKKTGSRTADKALKFTRSSAGAMRRLMKDDEKAYMRLRNAIKLKRGTDISGYYKAAAKAPYKACAILDEASLHALRLSRCYSRALASDLTEAAILLEAAYFSSSANVFINLKGIGDKRYAMKVKRDLSGKCKRISKMKQEVLKKTGLL